MKATAALAGLCLLGAAPADPLLTRLLTGAAEVPPAALSFERAAELSETSGGRTERHWRVERWDGRSWTAVSIDGRDATPAQTRDAAKAIAASGVPGYYRVAVFLRAATSKTVEPGTTVYHLATLPPGTLAVKGASPDRFAADLTVDTTGPVPFVRRARYFAPASFRVLMVARLDRFEAVYDYRLGKADRPELARQTIDLSGALFGRDGSQHSEYAYAYR